MKVVLMYIGIGVLIVSLIAAVIYGARTVSSVATPTHLFEPVDGIQCVSLTVDDSVAVDCWEKRQ